MMHGGPARWEHFEHGADVGVRGRGPTRAFALANAAVALTAVVVDPGRVAPVQPVEITCDAPDDELLLVAWLNAVVFEMATRRMLFACFDVALDGRRLRAIAWGEPVDIARHEPAVEIKGATLTLARLAQEADGTWLAQTVLDV